MGLLVITIMTMEVTRNHNHNYDWPNHLWPCLPWWTHGHQIYPPKILSVIVAKPPILTNLQSSSANTPLTMKSKLSIICFPVPNLAPNAIHLGHPLIFNQRDISKAYGFIVNKFKAKLTTVEANKLNHADSLTYINSMLASIPIYYMSTVLFSKTFIAKNYINHKKFLVGWYPGWKLRLSFPLSFLGRYLPNKRKWGP